jgi:hypothetical protein
MYSTILTNSSINLRLDISSHSATKKKPWHESAGVFYFERSIKRSLNAKVRNKKNRRRRRRMQGFFFVKQPIEDQAERSPPLLKTPAGAVRLNPPHVQLRRGWQIILRF